MLNEAAGVTDVIWKDVRGEKKADERVSNRAPITINVIKFTNTVRQVNGRTETVDGSVLDGFSTKDCFRLIPRVKPPEKVEEKGWVELEGEVEE